MRIVFGTEFDVRTRRPVLLKSRMAWQRREKPGYAYARQTRYFGNTSQQAGLKK